MIEEVRESRDPGPISRVLTLTANALGGYDDDLTTALDSGAALPMPMASGSIQYLDAELGYFRGHRLRSIKVDTRGDLLANQSHLAAPGGVATVGAKTTVGRSLTFGVSGEVRYEPFFSVFSPSAGSAPQPPGVDDMVPSAGLFERGSLLSGTSLSLDRMWSPQDSTALSYSYRVRRFTGDDRGNNISHGVQAEYARKLARWARARVKYGYADGHYIASDEGALPTSEHRLEAGPEIDKALSRRRNLTLSLAAGASSVEAVGSTDRKPHRFSVPVGSVSATLGLSPRWVVEGGFRRHFSLLQGVTDDVYTTDTAFLTSRRFITARTDLRTDATYSNWKTPLSRGYDGRLRVYGLSLRASVALNAKLAVTAGYFYYHHRYSNPGALPAAFPAHYDRHAVRVGLTVWVPLLGTSPTSATPLLSR